MNCLVKFSDNIILIVNFNVKPAKEITLCFSGVFCASHPHLFVRIFKTFTFKSFYRILLPLLFLFLYLVIFLSVGNAAFVQWHCTQHILDG